MRKFYVFILITAVFATSGCATSGSRRSSDTEMPKTLQVATLLKFQDVPVPSGFKIIPADSYVFDNEITRLGILKYSGRARTSKVTSFYRDQMPLYNWRFINLMEFNTCIINFDREDQTCTIIVEPGHLSTFITVSVAPKAGRASTYKVEEEK